MLEVRQTQRFLDWLDGLGDSRAQAAIADRINRLQFGHVGDAKPLGDRVSELRIHAGPGYRVYFTKRKLTLIILLCGGDKNTQVRDIARAKKMAREI